MTRLIDALDRMVLNRETLNLKEINRIRTEFLEIQKDETVDYMKFVELKTKMELIQTEEHKDKIEFFIKILDMHVTILHHKKQAWRAIKKKS